MFFLDWTDLMGRVISSKTVEWLGWERQKVDRRGGVAKASHFEYLFSPIIARRFPLCILGF